MAEYINGETDIIGGSVVRYNLNTSTPGQSVITRLIAGNGISITSTGADSGTGEVTISIASSSTSSSSGSVSTPSSASGVTGVGTVTSINMTVPSAMNIIGTPITTAGTLALSLKDGFIIPTCADIDKAITAYAWGDHHTMGYVNRNIYTGDGTLTGNRTVTMGGKTLLFTGGDITFKGSGTGSTSYPFLIQNSSSSNVLELRADGILTIGSAGFFTSQIIIANSGAYSGMFSVAYNSYSDNVIRFKNYNSDEYARFSAVGNLLLGLTGDLGYKLNVNGTIKVSGDFTFGGTQNFFTSTNPYIFYNRASTAGGITFAPANVIDNASSNAVVIFDTNYGNITYTTGTYTFNALSVLAGINVAAGYTGTIRGFYYNPTVTSIGGATHYAFESTSGRVKISDLSGTGTRMVVADSSGVLSTQSIPTGGSGVTLTLTTTGSSGASTYNSGTGALNIPTYTLSGLGGVSNNIYTADGTTTGDRTVSTANNIITFASTPTASANSQILSKFIIDPTFSVGSFTGSVRIGLQLQRGAIYKKYYTDTVTNNFYIGSGYELYGDPHSSSGYTLYFSGGDNGSWQSGWDLVFGSKTDRIVTITSGGVTIKPTLTIPGGFVHGQLQSLSTSPNVGFIFQPASGWNFVIKDGTNADVFKIANTTSNVIIGGTSDFGYKLDVQGTLRATGIAYLNSRVNINGATDDANYSLNVTGNFKLSSHINATGGIYTANKLIAPDIGIGGYVINGPGVNWVANSHILGGTSTQSFSFYQNYGTAESGRVTKVGAFKFSLVDNNGAESRYINVQPSTTETFAFAYFNAGYSTTQYGVQGETMQAIRIGGTIDDANSRQFTWLGHIINPILNTGLSNATVIGYYYNPTLTVTPLKNIAIQTVTGDVYLNTTSGRTGIGTTTVGAKLHVVGDTTFLNTGSIASYANQTTTIAAAATFNSGGVWAGLSSYHNPQFGGSSTVSNGAVIGGFVGVNRITFTASAATITMSPSGSAIRAIAGMQTLQQTGGTINGTVSHGASLFIQGVYPSNTANVTFTNYYGILINPIDEWAGVTFTNKYAIYQASSGDNNYFAGKVLIGTSTASTYILDVSGTTRLQGDAYLNGSITQVGSLAGSGDRFVIADANGKLATATIGSGLSYSGGVLSATGGSAGTVTATPGGTAGYLAKFSSSTNLVNSIVSESGTVLSVGGSISATSSVTATSFIKTGGTSTQFLMADGSVTTSTFLVSGSFVSDYDSAITGLRNSSNKVFTLTQNYQSGTTKVYVNGIRYSPGGSNDYTESSSNQITFANAPDAGDLILVDYIKA